MNLKITPSDKKLIKTPQYQQWKRVGLIEELEDEGEFVWRWKEEIRKSIQYSILHTVTEYVKGEPIWPVLEERERMTRLIKETWFRFFDQDGFYLIDEA